MATTYVDVTELEFDSLLKSEKGWTKEVQGSEWVYVYRSVKKPDIIVKVFSSVTKKGIGRKRGGDAIRVCAVNTRTNKGVWKCKRVHRVPGWEDRVKERVLETLQNI